MLAASFAVRQSKTRNLFILNLAAGLRCQHTAKSVNHVAIVTVDDVPIRGLHFETIARRPGAAAQHTPVTTGCTAASFVSVEAPFPNVSAEIVQAYRIRFKTADRHCCGAAPSAGGCIISGAVGRRPLFSPRKFVFDFAI